MNIFLISDGFMNWQGGRDFFRMLCASLNSGLSSNDQLFVWSCPTRDSLPWRTARVAKHLLTRFPPDATWVAAELQRRSTAVILRESLGETARRSKILGSRTSNVALRGGADAVGSFTSPPAQFRNVPWVGYLPDCQHRRRPEFFSQTEISVRDRQFSAILASANVVLVNSRSTKNDILEIFSPFRSEIVSLPFAAAPEEAWLAGNDHAVLERYSITSPFFLCSNQFWQHKNHGVILEAISLSKHKGKPVNFVFTGAMDDYRNPAYVPTLLSRVRDLGIGEYCKFLGLIPKIEQIQLIKFATAVVQPTLFEGGPGGGAIFDAISLGRPTIVSNLPVNREIEEYVSSYFDPVSPQQLLDGLLKLEVSAAPASPNPDALRRAGAARRKRCGEVLLDAFRRSVEIAKECSPSPGDGHEMRAV
jgi:glycosyltransferase involved in cell wall biosynthesis